MVDDHDRGRRSRQLRLEKRLGASRLEVVEELRAELDEAVRIRLRSDVPLGAFLSGGMDSATTAAIATRVQVLPDVIDLSLIPDRGRDRRTAEPDGRVPAPATAVKRLPRSVPVPSPCRNATGQAA